MFSQVCWAQSLIRTILTWLDQVASHAVDQTCSEGIEKAYQHIFRQISNL